MESVKLPLLSYEKSPGLSAVQQCAQNTGSVDLDLVIFRKLLVGPYSLGQAGKWQWLPCLAVWLGVQRRSVLDRRAKVLEVMDNLHFVLQDCNAVR